MAKLLVNQPSGEQSIIEIDSTGSYFDQARVVWDERVDGEMPTVIIGKMQISGNKLITLDNFLPDHQAWIELMQIKNNKIADAIDLGTDVKSDDDLILIREMNSEKIDTWFDTNIKDIVQLSDIVKKIVKSLVKQGIL